MKMTSSSLRIVHACNFHYNKDGAKFDTMDQKVHLGFSENGHYTYAFPVHDIARQMTWRNSKRSGAKKHKRTRFLKSPHQTSGDYKACKEEVYHVHFRCNERLAFSSSDTEHTEFLAFKLQTISK